MSASTVSVDPIDDITAKIVAFIHTIAAWHQASDEFAAHKTAQFEMRASDYPETMRGLRLFMAERRIENGGLDDDQLARAVTMAARVTSYHRPGSATFPDAHIIDFEGAAAIDVKVVKSEIAPQCTDEQWAEACIRCPYPFDEARASATVTIRALWITHVLASELEDAIAEVVDQIEAMEAAKASNVIHLDTFRKA